eukprot:scaffold17670_cov99-Cyclotella_meneghiniana.AAC.2
MKCGKGKLTVVLNVYCSLHRPLSQLLRLFHDHLTVIGTPINIAASITMICTYCTSYRSSSMSAVNRIFESSSIGHHRYRRRFMNTALHPKRLLDIANRHYT